MARHCDNALAALGDADWRLGLRNNWLVAARLYANTAPRIRLSDISDFRVLEATFLVGGARR
jgi:hypothetical protein